MTMAFVIEYIVLWKLLMLIKFKYKVEIHANFQLISYYWSFHIYNTNFRYEPIKMIKSQILCVLLVQLN